MKTFLFCTCYMDIQSKDLHPRRYRRWIDYYSPLMDKLGADYLFLMDDGSAEVSLGDDVAVVSPHLPDHLTSRVTVVRFPDRLGRPAHDDYLGWWRSFSFSWEVARKYGFEKIIHIESDFYVTSDDLLEFLKSRSSGWTALFSRFSNFAESSIQVICKDAFEDLQQLYQDLVRSKYYSRQIAEVGLPFTDVVKGFRGDRFGDLWRAHDILLHQVQLDYYSALIKSMAGYMDQLIKEDYFSQSLDYVAQVPPDIAIPTAPELFKIYDSLASLLSQQGTRSDSVPAQA